MDKLEPPYVNLDDNGKWAFYESGKDDEVYVDIDGDGRYDFSQSGDLQEPCDVFEDLKRYKIIESENAK